MTLDEMLEALIKREGGYVNNPHDRGKATKYGITLATLSDWRSHPMEPEDVEHLAIDEAKAIYTAWYYKKPQVDKLPESLQPIMLDSCVLYGGNRAWKLMQLALNKVDNLNLAVDGIPGVKTFAAIEHADSVDVLNEIIRQRLLFHESIVNHNPGQAVFLNGWRNRANSFRMV